MWRFWAHLLFLEGRSPVFKVFSTLGACLWEAMSRWAFVRINISHQLRERRRKESHLPYLSAIAILSWSLQRLRLKRLTAPQSTNSPRVGSCMMSVSAGSLELFRSYSQTLIADSLARCSPQNTLSLVALIWMMKPAFCPEMCSSSDYAPVSPLYNRQYGEQCRMPFKMRWNVNRLTMVSYLQSGQFTMRLELTLSRMDSDPGVFSSKENIRKNKQSGHCWWSAW